MDFSETAMNKTLTPLPSWPRARATTGSPWFSPVAGLATAFFAGLSSVSATEPVPAYVADFEGPAFSIGSIDGQQGWWVDQGIASIVPGIGLFGSAGLSVAPSQLFSQARLSLERSAQSSAVLYFDAWVRLPAAPWEVLDETFDLESARIGLFGAAPFTHTAEWHVFHGDGSGSGSWLGTGVFPALLPDLDFTQDWTRLTVKVDGPAQSWDLWADGTLVASGLGLQFPPEPDFAHFFVLGDLMEPIILDNVSISSENPLQPAAAEEPPPAAVTSGPDTDLDGLPDAWEIAHQLNPEDPTDSSLDRDGDGLTALDEFLLGTNEAVKDGLRLAANQGATVFNRFAGQSSRRAVTPR